MREDKQKYRKKLAVKWKLFIGISFCGILLISSWLLGQRFETVRSFLNTFTQPVQQGYRKAEKWADD